MPHARLILVPPLMTQNLIQSCCAKPLDLCMAVIHAILGRLPLDVPHPQFLWHIHQQLPIPQECLFYPRHFCVGIILCASTHAQMSHTLVNQPVVEKQMDTNGGSIFLSTLAQHLLLSQSTVYYHGCCQPTRHQQENHQC